MLYSLSCVKSNMEMMDVFSVLLGQNKQRKEHEPGSEMTLITLFRNGRHCEDGKTAFNEALPRLPPGGQGASAIERGVMVRVHGGKYGGKTGIVESVSPMKAKLNITAGHIFKEQLEVL
jgi:hypothetical protein